MLRLRQATDSRRHIQALLAAVVDGWMQSAGHRADLLSSRFQETGVGIWHAGTTYDLTEVFLERPRPARS